MDQPETVAVTILIGNTDNELSQHQWAHFAIAMHDTITNHVHQIQYRGGADWDAPWQNACWVCEVTPQQLQPLLNAVTDCRTDFLQDAAAVIVGDLMLV